MADRHDLPYQAEYAKSNRSTCKACRTGIKQGNLRMAVMVQSPVFDGKVPNWFHFACFWKRSRVSNHQEIHNFDSLRWEDQKNIKDKIAGGSGGINEKSAAAGGSGPAVSDFKAEYAKSNRSKCRGCEEKIDKDALRLSKKDFTSERAKMYGPQDTWYHVDCFVKNRDELEFADKSVDDIVGYKTLKKEDQKELVEKLGKGSSTSSRKRKEDDKSKAEAKKPKKETEEEKQMKVQNNLLWGFRDKLEKEISVEALKVLLELNEQAIPSGESKLLDSVSDCMAFGALAKCPECPEGKLTFKSDGYRCTGNITSWTKCFYVTRTPKRKAFKIPSEYHDADVLKKYKYKKRDRVFAAETASSKEGPVSSVDVLDGLPSKPLKGLKFAIVGNLDFSEEQITQNISNMGGQIVTTIDKNLAACISNKESITKPNKQIKAAKKAGVHVVSTAFLEDVKKGGVLLMIQKHNLAPWGDDPQKRIIVPYVSKSGASNPRNDTHFTKSIPDKLKMMVKGGAAVDPDSKLAKTAHVIEDGGDIYNAVLGLVDVTSGTNSYYKLQALESDKKSGWWVFRSWGRVGTTIGNNKKESFSYRAAAIQEFKDLYFKKTNNHWWERHNFQKFPNKFYPLDIDYGQDDDNIKKLDLSKSTSTLHKSIQDLICMIFDIESMKRAMMEFEIDLKKMPLGKLSKKQIESAYKVLNELTELVDKKSSVSLFSDASNRFYTLIPHDFGLNKPPLLDTIEIIKQKIEMLDNLLEIEVAYNLLKGGDDGNDRMDAIDAHYQKLKTDIEYIERSSEEFDLITKYVQNTHAVTHNQYGLEVVDAYRLERLGEKERFRPFEELANHKLLWHGSRVTNFAGILSQGLRVAPPEAPVTGYMFGKGIYFADMVSKSANYCHTSKNDPVGLILLCDVALGSMYELTSANYVTSLPKGKHSTKGCGRTVPDPSGRQTFDGVEIPMGKGVPSDIDNSSLLYNEYIVYDVAQVKIKYLLRLKFNYKW
ncbi:[ADP-ribose] polymerase 1-like [Octopus vulgaris]|uniref:Poly [ADP-ribose] polymerase n=2 Tax=Octopus vulgaris TaxID=6645 RepID=A0AA36BBW3_OCTVU|nr:[ADP-ribose] polymerase 1-like [Octopus vulgaris]